jgi:ADP/ATP carrier protein family
MSFLPKISTKTFKDIFWPIEQSELKIFIPISLLMLCVLFNFASLRSIKDGLVVPTIGPESISFLKLWLVLPFTILFTIIFVKLSNYLTYEQMFYAIITGFLLFFFAFAYIIYPHQEYFHPSKDLIQSLTLAHPHGKWFIEIMGKWSYALMYIFSELWSAVVINLLFWQLANHIFDTASAKKFYPILGMIGNFGLIIAGTSLASYSDISQFSTEEMEIYTTSIDLQCTHVLKPMINLVILSGILSMVIYWIINNVLLTDKKAAIKHINIAPEPTKTKLSLAESVKLIVRSRYIGHIMMLILSYGLVMNILEGPWKAQVKALYPNTIDYINFMGKFNICLGVSCVLFTIIGGNILRRFSWLVSAMTTPIMIGITGSIFFTCVIFSDFFSTVFNDFNPIYFAVLVGAIQNILSKSTKYSLFDATKEMSYIPLSLELKTKGKAAADLIGIKFGKSMGAALQSSMFIIFPNATFDSIIVYLLVFFVIIIVVWISNIISLNKQYLAIQKNN